MKDPIEALLQGGAQRPGPDPRELAAMVRDDPAAVGRLAELLGSADPRVRGGAAEALAALADLDAQAVVHHLPSLVMALEQEETQTRLAAYQALAAVASAQPDALEEDFDTIRLGLFDPANPLVRRQAALAVARYGAGDPARGKRAFPHLAESLRRFHDQPHPAGLLEAIAILARAEPDDHLKAEIWKAVRRHEQHTDPAVRGIVGEIAGCVR